MPVAHVPAESGTARNTVGGNANVPCGSMSLDNLVVVCALDDSGTGLPNVPAGFTSLASIANVYGAVVAARKVTAADISGNVSYAFNSGGINNIALLYEVFSGARMITASEVTSNTQTASGTPLIYSANTMDDARSASLLFGKAAPSVSITPPANWNELHDMGAPTLESCLRLTPGAGALTPANGTLTGSSSGRGTFHVEILSADAASIIVPRRAHRGLVLR